MPAPEGELPEDVNPKPHNDAAEAVAPAAPVPPAKAGGNAESRYLTIVYGMIKAHLHESPELHLDSASKRGAVDFYVDESGTLVGRKLVSSSGSPNLRLGGHGGN